MHFLLFIFISLVLNKMHSFNIFLNLLIDLWHITFNYTLIQRQSIAQVENHTLHSYT